MLHELRKWDLGGFLLPMVGILSAREEEMLSTFAVITERLGSFPELLCFNRYCVMSLDTQAQGGYWLQESRGTFDSCYS